MTNKTVLPSVIRQVCGWSLVVSWLLALTILVVATTIWLLNGKQGPLAQKMKILSYAAFAVACGTYWASRAVLPSLFQDGEDESADRKA